ncbi:MBL fold metallo-hydrolase [Jannaschia sp. S6380]|uniref:MBL fold metallo-hydrolase n=1 Tax=Jannaschia sp. S6380 TaxID=2926408 RepID=UPI001FF45AA1|nr:MBL fold metallo-hydrolase [Jannaschia sp. S6380]MCK0166961.1 MBL fold metallo-hydrolase [Jannaschia sp. S6380]
MAQGYPGHETGESGLMRLRAPNPSPMTADGTNSYVLGHDDVAIIDPGPAIADHLDRIVAAVGGRPVVGIFVTHSHLDHSPGARPLTERLRAPVMGFGPSAAGRSAIMARLSGLAGGEGVDADFDPEVRLRDGEQVDGDGWSLRAHWTPGHMGNHLSFEWCEARVVFTGDTVMGWASTMISPPDGDLGQFMASLDRLEALDARRFHSGHGAPIDTPAARCRALRAHRQGREAAILDAMDGPVRIPDLVARIYADTPPTLHAAAARNVLAHLIHLAERNHVKATPAPLPEAIWRRT